MNGGGSLESTQNAIGENSCAGEKNFIIYGLARAKMNQSFCKSGCMWPEQMNKPLLNVESLRLRSFNDARWAHSTPFRNPI